MGNRRRQPAFKPRHSRLALATGALGVAATAGAAVPPVRGLAARWIQLLIPAAERSADSLVADSTFSALYLLPFLAVLACSLLAIVLGLLSHLRSELDRHTNSLPSEMSRSQLATVGIVGGGVGLWLLLLT